MILFVFEGAEREPKIFKTLERLFFGEEERIVCSFGNNIYELYRQLKEFDGDGDIVSILRENNAHLPQGIKSSDFSEIYLFFDYDFQNTNLSLGEMNDHLRELLEMFNNETDNGKLFVSYPMVESLCYTKQLPDAHFVDYTISRSECVKRSFKDLARAFSYYGSLDFIELPYTGHHQAGKKEIDRVRQNWIWLVQQNVSKASYICEGVQHLPAKKEAVSQPRIFESQCLKYLSVGEKIAILNGFPLFLFDYFKAGFWKNV
ncbi:MAG: hypothetical protein ILA23_07720 [Bacteroidales bacterium]|nr:hypothetical protein [Bacteroidales bacterium]MBR1501838.1 hypothetical protein [Bacteroidales bacterium]